MTQKSGAFDSFALPQELYEAARVKANEFGTTRSDLYRIAIDMILRTSAESFKAAKEIYAGRYGETRVGRPKGSFTIRPDELITSSSSSSSSSSSDRFMGGG